MSLKRCLVNSLFTSGLEFVRETQKALGPGLLVPIKAITFLGSELFVLSVLPLIYWCVDRKRGARIGIIVLFSVFSNLWVKSIFQTQRPYELDPSVGLARESSKGFPSGHSQTSMTFWGVSMTILPRRIGLAAFITLPFLVGLSRIYLGVHFPIDILGGWALGGIFVLLFYLFEPKIEAILHLWPTRYRFIAVALVTLAMNYLIPSDTMLGGAFFGSGAGFVLASKNLRFEARGSSGTKVLRYLVGIAGTLMFYLGPKLILGEAFSSQEALIRFIRYAMVGFWVAYGAPWVFQRLKLIELETADR
jgi:membrane-associated phospholipid phosphatase